jgi:diguanylate cyclase (GGDEF)-like protein
MIPSQRDPQDDQTLLNLVESSADRDQTDSDRDQTGSDRDQGASDLDQLAADSDQAASDRTLAHGVNGEAYASSRDARERTTQARRETSTERHITAGARDVTAHERDLSALARDGAAAARDLEDDGWDAEIASLTSFFGTQPATGGAQTILRAARERQQAASHRARSATRRADARGDRERAASDRLLAAEDRLLAAKDRARAAEPAGDEVDILTGARRLGPGLADMQHEIHRANRGNGRLVVACVNFDGLKATNDAKGHQAGNAILKHIVNVLETNLRSHGSIIRLGSDEFVCTISDTSIENVRQRFDEIVAELNLTLDDGSISVGFAELVRGDSPMDLIDRADRRLVASRDTKLAIAGPHPDPAPLNSQGCDRRPDPATPPASEARSHRPREEHVRPFTA